MRMRWYALRRSSMVKMVPRDDSSRILHGTSLRPREIVESTAGEGDLRQAGLRQGGLKPEVHGTVIRLMRRQRQSVMFAENWGKVMIRLRD